RAAHHSDVLELELTARHVPFVKYGGLKFLEAAHVKDFLAVLRVVGNRRDELAWFRLLRLHEGVGPARGRALLPLALESASISELVARAPAPARTRLDATLRGIEAARSVAPSAAVDTCAAVLRPLVQARYDDANARLADLDRLADAARLAPDLASFVA